MTKDTQAFICEGLGTGVVTAGSTPRGTDCGHVGGVGVIGARDTRGGRSDIGGGGLQPCGYVSLA